MVVLVIIILLTGLSINVNSNVLVPARRSTSFPVKCPDPSFSCLSQFTGCVLIDTRQMCVWCSRNPSVPCALNTHFSLPTPPPTLKPTFPFTPSPTREPTTITHYKMDVIFKSSVPSWLRTIAQNAVRKWEDLIIGDYEQIFTVPNSNCPDVPQGTQVDDTLISIGYQYIDGASGSNTLAYAGTCFFSQGKSRVGVIVLDSSNFPSSGSAVLAYNVIIHEIGHILGIQSTAWRNAGLVNNALRYTGVHANSQLSLSGANHNQAFIEDLYGQGSAGSHWRESVYDSEVMTSLASHGQMPLSRITIGALEDLGYQVDYSKADPYTVPSPNGRRRLRKKKGIPFHAMVGELPFKAEETGLDLSLIHI